MGRHVEALELYDRALGLGGKSFYESARAACAGRIAAARAFEAPSPPASVPRPSPR